MGSNKKSKKRKRSVPAEPSDEEMFAVEVILKARVAEGAPDKGRDDHWDYYVKWAGYDSDANTWEPAKNLSECERLVKSFWEAVGWDDVDYPEGAEVVPSIDWIVAEKTRFWQGLGTKEREVYMAKEKERRAERQAHNMSSPELSREPQKRPKSKKKKGKKSRAAVEESEADSDIPLIKRERLQSKTIPAKRKEAPPTSDDEPLDQRTKRKTKTIKLDTPVQSTSASSRQSLQPEPELSKGRPSISSLNQPKVDKATPVVETRSDSPSSLFSVDSSEEIVAPSAVPKHEPQVHPAPERKTSMSFPLIRGGNSKPSPTIPAKPPLHPYLKRPEPAPLSAPVTGIPTKQRLGAGALDTFNPKDARAKTSLPPRTTANPNPSSSNLSSLKFRKNSTIVIVPNEQIREMAALRSPGLTLNALNAPATQDQPMVADSTLIDSPIGMEPPYNPSPYSPQVFQHSNALEADEFLSSITGSLPGFASPIEPTIEPTFQPRPPPSLTVARKASNIPKIPKKWKWEGQLFILSANDDEELVGPVVCTNVTSPKPRGMRIHLTFDAMDRLNFISFHDLSDILTFLEACKTPDQFATLTAQNSESQSQFRDLAHYMAKHQRVVLVPVWYEKNVVGHLLVFHPTLQDLVQQLEVPRDLLTQATDNLIVSLQGWIINPTLQQHESRLPLSDIVPAKTSLAPSFSKGRLQNGLAGPNFDHASSLRTFPFLHFSLRALNFPPDLFDWLTTSFRIYALYHEYERGDDKSEPVEFKMLRTVLKGCQAQEWKHHEPKKERLRVVFVHVGSIRNFSRSPLTQRRESLDIRFYSYGTDGSVPRNMWGIKEIYPVGGIVTFYPSAFVEDYIGTIQLIRKIHEHPLWMGFISPVCLGYLTSFAYRDYEPLVSYEQQGQNFACHSLLQSVAEGEIALISVPSDSSSTESMKLWMQRHCRIIGPLDALSMGKAALHSVCANVAQTNWMGAVQKNIDHDIVAIQRHPAILYKYRRFIVIEGEKNRVKPSIPVEATTPRQFIFQDDYFQPKS